VWPRLAVKVKRALAEGTMTTALWGRGEFLAGPGGFGPSKAVSPLGSATALQKRFAQVGAGRSNLPGANRRGDHGRTRRRTDRGNG
ncbi:MAG: hypothetical protein NTW86_10930, partial [Candidatus Sumerlaeota bacterium]|nr:hypothetical protein [Candidatus Sumerlaeota bacterium]